MYLSLSLSLPVGSFKHLQGFLCVFGVPYVPTRMYALLSFRHACLILEFHVGSCCARISSYGCYPSWACNNHHLKDHESIYNGKAKLLFVCFSIHLTPGISYHTRSHTLAATSCCKLSIYQEANEHLAISIWHR